MEPDRWPARLFAQLHSLPQTQHRGLATLSHFLTFTWTWILIWKDSMKRQTKPQKAWWKFNFRMNELEIMWQNKGLWYLSFVTLAIAFLCSHLSALTRMLAMSVLTKRKETNGPSWISWFVSSKFSYLESPAFNLTFQFLPQRLRSLMMDVSAYHGRGEESDHLFGSDTQNCPTHAQLNLP